MARLHKVDPTTIKSTTDFEVISTKPTDCGTSAVPFSVKCLSPTFFRDNPVFTIGDYVTNGTKMKGNITGFEFFVDEETSELICFVQHTWSGIGMGLSDIYHTQKLPSRFQIGEYVSIRFKPNFVVDKAEVTKVHFTENKVQYDLRVELGKGSGKTSTKIYNVEESVCEVV